MQISRGSQVRPKSGSTSATICWKRQTQDLFPQGFKSSNLFPGTSISILDTEYVVSQDRLENIGEPDFDTLWTENIESEHAEQFKDKVHFLYRFAKDKIDDELADTRILQGTVYSVSVDHGEPITGYDILGESQTGQINRDTWRWLGAAKREIDEAYRRYRKEMMPNGTHPYDFIPEVVRSGIRADKGILGSEEENILLKRTFQEIPENIDAVQRAEESRKYAGAAFYRALDSPVTNRGIGTTKNNQELAAHSAHVEVDDITYFDTLIDSYERA